MALISCPECGNEVSDRAPACPKCGVPIHRESRIVVNGYTQVFALNPKVTVFWDGVEVGQVGQGGRLVHEIEKDGEVSFRCNMRKAKVQAKAGEITNIKISWNRFSGKMIAQVVDVVTPGDYR